ncbi:MAG TPA: MgtC/SapB family protein [Burkholderiales bacterium]|nr:MgtC/SapB family protein [Burkholderiales bacterium]
METLTLDSLARYWSANEVAANLIVVANVVGALLLGLLVGYERSYHGRAAGMRTYGLVCMASCALTVVVGFPGYWFGGALGITQNTLIDPTRVIQGIVTGVGFLGAGVIMKEGLNISGLTTAASIWSSSAIGILVGLGFYFAAILVAVLSAALMMWASKLEQWLPSHPAFAITMRFRPGFVPQESALAGMAREQGFTLASGTVQIQQAAGRQEWRFVAITGRRDVAISKIAERLGAVEGVEEFQVSGARN